MGSIATAMLSWVDEAFWRVPRELAMRWECGATVAGIGFYAWRKRRRALQAMAEMRRERRMREELEAYAQLDATIGQGMGARADRMPAMKALAMRVCRTVADKSAFRRVLVMLRNAEGSLRCVGWIGVDDLTVAAVERWGAQVVKEEREGKGRSRSLLGGLGAKSVPIRLGEWQEFDPEIDDWHLTGRKERRRWRRAIALPIRASAGAELGGNAGRMMGAIVVCADGLKLPGDFAPGRTVAERMMSPLESLAVRLGMTLDNEVLGERLLRAEKLAGLGQMAGGVAHALNNPLTAVMGYAELIAETGGEARVQEQARTIMEQARKMRETVQRLVEFWRPVTTADGAVDVLEMIAETGNAWRHPLEERGVKLEVLTQAGVGAVRGSRERIAQVIEQLLKNSTQAIAKARPREEDEDHAIRISVSQDEQTVFLIVSDTGTGFEEPGRAFDPFYTTKDPVEGAGLGLSICYGIVREHGGEIAAFNLHPHGAAVVVELPVGMAVREQAALARQERQSLTPMKRR
jgi:signal transduction histidine kinase